MIHAVTAANKHIYGIQLEQMFRARETALRARGAAQRYGIDDLDNDDAIYVLRLDDEGGVLESVRLNPALGEPGVWEASLWPEAPSKAFVAGVVKVAEERGEIRLGLPAGASIAR
jgi:hypothetical protein